MKHPNQIILLIVVNIAISVFLLLLAERFYNPYSIGYEFLQILAIISHISIAVIFVKLVQVVFYSPKDKIEK
jgi:hypothetical protein